MLYANITPNAVSYIQINPFSATSLNGDYMTAIANPYPLGANTVNFQVQFGSVTFVDSSPTAFNVISQTYVTLSGSELSNWGVDDSVVLEEIASVLGCTINSTIQF